MVLALGTFQEQLRGCLVTVHGDNDSVRCNMMKGSSRSPEQNVWAGRLWLYLIRQHIALWMNRVCSESNPSDMSTRYDDSLCERFGMKWMEPWFPTWAVDVRRPLSWAADGNGSEVSEALACVLSELEMQVGSCS